MADKAYEVLKALIAGTLALLFIYMVARVAAAGVLNSIHEWRKKKDKQNGV